jgi:uncharacterized repeat protein (TIGR03803 family)
MRSKIIASPLCGAMVAFLFVIGTASGGRAAAETPATEKVLYSFGYIFPDADNPEGGLVFDTSGNLYGTTFAGGLSGGYGAVYELSPSGGGWTETILYSFCPNCAGGSSPLGSLAIDAEGNLYGTAFHGGGNGCGGGCGVVFELSPGAQSWNETVVYAFSGGSDGAIPFAGLVFDTAGNLYGTTLYGGTGKCPTTGFAPGCGVVFELSKSTTGDWTETVLHSFQGGKDGDSPSARVTLDGAGNVFGTTAGSAPDDPGTVFKLAHEKTGKWNETVLYRFAGAADGNSPEADVVLDKEGSVYGTTRYGGTGKCSAYGYKGCGTVFKVQHSEATWTESVLHSFGVGESGEDPAAGLVFNATGDLYGTTAEGGNGCGTVFQLTPTSGGKWSEKVLHRFACSTSDGAFPLGDLILDSAGNIYSTDQYGGTYDSGTVFEVTP